MRLPSQLELATRELAPAVLDGGGQQARLETHLSDVRGRGRGRDLVLSPIATEGLPSELDRVRLVVLGGHDIVLHGRRARVGDGEVSIPLEGARIVAMPSHRRAVRRAPRDPRVLVVPHGGDELDLYALPVLDVSRDGCAVESSDALPPGRQLPAVELWGDRRLLRRATATVLETIPWRTPDGDRRFRMRLALTDATDAAVRHADQLTDADRVRYLLEVAVLVGSRVGVELPGGARLDGELLRAEAGELVVRVEATTLVAARVRITFEVFAVSYAMDVRVIRWSTDDREVVTAFPLVVHRRQRRYQFRAPVPPEVDLRLSAHNPATGQRLERRVGDLSFGGASFASDPDADVLWPGLTLEDGALDWAHGSVGVGEMEVRHVEDGGTCRVELRTASALDSTAFVDLMARLRYPRMEVGTGDDFEAMVRLYEEVGLFGAHMTRNLPPVRDEAAVTWERLHRTDLCRTLVQREDGRPVAAVSAVRAWEQSWVIQHMVAAPTRRHREPGVLHMAYLDYLLPRPDGRYMIVFVNAANRRITAFLERFFELTGTPEAIARRDVGLWVLHGDRSTGGIRARSDLVVRPLRRRDELVVQRAAERLFGRLGAAALSLRQGEIRIPQTREAFAAQRIGRARRSHLVTRRGYPLLALVEERADPGFNLTWLVNATWVLPVHTARHAGAALRAAARHIAREADPVGAGDRFAMIPVGTDTRAFEEAGFEREADVTVHSYNRAGLHRWYYFIRARYGEIHARKRADAVVHAG